LKEVIKPASRHSSPGRVFILRLWPERLSEQVKSAVWRVSLQDAHTQARRGFASLEEFFDYLESICNEAEVG
jgi:hypothetical protein